MRRHPPEALFADAPQSVCNIIQEAAPSIPRTRPESAPAVHSGSHWRPSARSSIDCPSAHSLETESPKVPRRLVPQVFSPSLTETRRAMSGRSAPPDRLPWGYGMYCSSGIKYCFNSSRGCIASQSDSVRFRVEAPCSSLEMYEHQGLQEHLFQATLPNRQENSAASAETYSAPVLSLEKPPLPGIAD